MMEGEVKECSTDGRSEKTARKNINLCFYLYSGISSVQDLEMLLICFRDSCLRLPDAETYLALATRRVSLKRKRCLSWVCRPVFSCAWA